MTTAPIAHVQLRKDGWIPATHAAKAIGVHVSTIYRAANEGKLAGRRVGRSWYVREDSVVAYYGGSVEVRNALAAL